MTRPLTVDYAVVLRLPWAVLVMVFCLSGCGSARVAGPVQVEGRLSAAQGERRVLTPAELVIDHPVRIAGGVLNVPLDCACA